MTPLLLDHLLAEARHQLSLHHPDAAADADVLQHLATVQSTLRPRRPGQRLWRWAGLGLGSVGLTGAGLLSLALWLPPPAAPAQPLLAFSPPKDWPADVLVVPTELPRERLAWLGLPTDGGASDRPVQAELVVHPSGRVLAVRLHP